MRVFFSSQCIINAIIITLLNINTFISIIMIKITLNLTYIYVQRYWSTVFLTLQYILLYYYNSLIERN